MRIYENSKGFSTTTAGDLPVLSKYGVLVAEDVAQERELLVAHLSQWGLNATGAADGREALSVLIKDDTIRLLITDLHMPELGGLELLQEVKNLARPKLYSIVLSGIKDRQTLINALQAGATDYMVKPCHPEQIFARLAVLDQVMALEEKYQVLIKDLFDVMGEMLGSRDPYSWEHSMRVAAISRRIGLHQGLSSEEVEVLEMGCLIHDVGKIAIPDDVLLKPCHFNNIDRQIMNMHPTIGAKYLAFRYPDDRVTEIILYHHERLDGSGYPVGLKGDDISPMVRIVSVADMYEALIAKRPYKSSISSSLAIKILKDEATEGRLDQNVVEALEKVVYDWNPLTIRRHPCKDIDELELFRRITYFREPMCSFYNYRYLLTLNKITALSIDRPEYFMIFINFKNLKQIDQKWGYLRADQMLDKIGENIQQSIKDFSMTNSEINGEALLFRRASDYLIFANHPHGFIQQLFDLIQDQLDTCKNKWELEASVLLESFPSTCSLEDALNQLLGTDDRGI
ncbi:MAG: response regulator [Thermodesulfobacteriota bacterium]|nr:response regulator [Thermodesulfobacteriota bacterium]